MVSTCSTARTNQFSTSSPQQLVQALGRLQSHQAQNQLGSIYIYDLVDQRTICASCSVASMLGYTADAIAAMGPVGLANLIHPDDLDSVSEHYQQFATLQPGEVISVNYRMQQASGPWRWLHSQETPLVTAMDGFPIQILGLIQVLAQPTMTQLKDLLDHTSLANAAN